MRAFRTAAALLLISAASDAAMAQPAGVKQVRVPADGAVALYSGWKCWRADCSFLPCRLDTVGKPRHGRVIPRVVASTIPAQGRDGRPTGMCAGRPIKGLNLIYRPDRGFRGLDEVIVHIVSEGRHTYTDRFVITVE